MKRLFKEPLVHFLALGALLFAGYGVLNRSGEPAPGRIVVSQGQLASMMENFTRIQQRPPIREEWEGLIRARVREEVYYREAQALGLRVGSRRPIAPTTEHVGSTVVMLGG